MCVQSMNLSGQKLVIAVIPVAFFMPNDIAAMSILLTVDEIMKLFFDLHHGNICADWCHLL